VAASLRMVFTAVAAGEIDAAARRVNDMLVATGAHPTLERHDGESWHIHFHSTDESSRVKSWAAGYATGLAVVLGGELYVALDLDLAGVGGGLQQAHDLVDEVIERHRVLVASLAGQQLGLTDGGSSSMTLTVESASCSRIDSLSM